MRQIARFKELYWVAGLVLLGVVLRSIADDTERSLRCILILSLGTSIFLLYQFVVDVYKAIRSSKSTKSGYIIGFGLVMWLWESISEAFWILVLVFSGELIRAWYLPLPEGFVWSWKNYLSEPGMMFLSTILIVGLKVALVTRRIIKC